MNPPLKLLLFMAATVAMLTFTDRASSAITRCPNCGSTPVPYPLSTSPTCGDQSYKIRCDSTNGTLQFDTRNNSYPIMSINPSIQQLVIKPSPLLPNTCVSSDLVHEGVQLDQSLPFNITSSNTIMFMNCTSFMLGTPLNCSSSSLCHVYINSTRGVAPCGDASSSICCSFKAGGTTTWYMIRVREGGCRAYTSFVNLDSNLAVDRWPDPGMEIKWKLPREPRCVSQADCDGNSTCGSDPIVGGSARRCFCMSGFEWDPIQGVCAEITCQNPGGCGGSTDRTALIAGLVAGIGVAIIAATIAILLYRRHKRIKEAQDRLTKEREDILNAGGGGKASKIFTGKEIKKATNNFSNDRLLGTGGYGEVYKGILTDGTIVAVKCAKLGNTKGTDQVLNEVRILCQVNHRSLVGLLGCCVELQQPIMVYEYISNGTLLEHLQGRKLGGRGHLTWRRRLQIAHDTAEGLAYLHSSAVPPIYHRDVKSSNILLDDKLTAKVADFGLSRLAHTDLSHISTCAQGTLGYLDPEYYKKYQLTDKSDVYSFGVVLLELLTSQKAIDFNRAADDVNLAIYVQRMMDEEKLMDTIDPMLRENVSNFEVDTMKALAFLAAGCLEDCRQNRPSMKEVTRLLGSRSRIWSGFRKSY
ncbi:hypothetical protein LWI28_022840 [Acer negundo]|uniref:Protein kinase domain-containing protein n=1 Tax=Acer negundo TaxID=4023 RepID=A0AAD5NHB2_ACENE|nr:hypothetical protein LWI28_022840 [Acer negundo]